MSATNPAPPAEALRSRLLAFLAAVGVSMPAGHSWVQEARALADALRTPDPAETLRERIAEVVAVSIMASPDVHLYWTREKAKRCRGYHAADRILALLAPSISWEEIGAGEVYAMAEGITREVSARVDITPDRRAALSDAIEGYIVRHYTARRRAPSAPEPPRPGKRTLASQLLAQRLATAPPHEWAELIEAATPSAPDHE